MVFSLSSVDLDTHVLIADAFAGLIVNGIKVWLETILRIIDPIHFPG